MSRHVLAAIILPCVATAASAQIQPPDETRDGMVARLTVGVADQPVGPGLAAVTYTVAVTGTLALETEPARLGDASAAWQFTSTCFGWLDGERLTLTERLELHQVKPGPAALPSIKVRFRSGPAAAWQDVEWTDLSAIHNGIKPDMTPLPPPWSPPRWFWPAVVGSALLPLLLLGAWWLTRPRAPTPPTARQWALRELAGLETGVGQLSAEWYHTRLAYIVRRFLTERHGLAAEQQTTAEFLAAVERGPALTPEQCALLRRFLERCDLAKFAPVNTTAEECRQTAALARQLVETTTEPAPPR